LWDWHIFKLEFIDRKEEGENRKEEGRKERNEEVRKQIRKEGTK